jgi:pyridoxine 4-dehydrogenase
MSKVIGICGKEVPRIGLGAMRLTGRGVWGDPPERIEAISLLRQSLETGVRFIDTADSYGPDTNETLIRDALYPYPQDLVVATKGGLRRPAPGVWENDASPRSLRNACIGSLKRLRLDCIDLYQLHAVDPLVPFEDSIGELSLLLSEGKIKHIGLSNVSVDQLRIARRLVTVSSVQNRYNLFDRSSEAVLAECSLHGIPFIPWYPFSAGTHLNSNGDNRLHIVDEIAAKRGASAAQVVLAWLLARSPFTLLIPGTSSPSHMKANFSAIDVQLQEMDITVLDEVWQTV